MKRQGLFWALVMVVISLYAPASQARDMGGLLAEAKGGNVKAEFLLSAYYFNQAGLDALRKNPLQERLDNNRDFYWLIRSAKGGYARAEEALGFDYLTGAGIQRNCGQGLWTRQSAAQHYLRAQKLLHDPAIIGTCAE